MSFIFSFHFISFKMVNMTDNDIQREDIGDIWPSLKVSCFLQQLWNKWKYNIFTSSKKFCDWYCKILFEDFREFKPDKKIKHKLLLIDKCKFNWKIPENENEEYNFSSTRWVCEFLHTMHYYWRTRNMHNILNFDMWKNEIWNDFLCPHGIHYPLIHHD